MKIISGKEVAEHITAELKNKAESLKKGNRRLPKLVIIRVGEKPDDLSYQKGAVKRMDMIGVIHEEVHFEENVPKEEFYKEFDEINNDESVDGILVLRPIPKHLDEDRLMNTINPKKDIDAISPVSLGKLMTGDKNGFAPCTAAGVIEILKYAGVKIRGKKVTIIGRSNVVGRPLALLFVSEDATVTVCHSFTADVKQAGKNAEILVASCGKAKLINSEYVAENAVVIDVGINFDENGKLCGDVDINDIEAVAAACTPVPGGVGAVTTSMLAKQLLLAYEAKEA
ncbi:tetrahydrofolate dehydrogenase/cyclohydrolase, NAD(P)-binding domain protein [Catonella morbi ATCC 51271]|uniref:Bifunctional protein FolD n=1 Tax=Catonella morbi ATCC 51271 TaxID=592026 RepID=V2Y5G9_9FIRM|nr:bifunctional 5,10-methylenetetrahydrofolate dehydrogenase/5,10-methenyltetrahydrofolate cyclohydrolase [Catonella morbi]ESL04178.1 tetrahydrofolate dehydrogenase/cyclohydrolase, NAD(P)-binding domain protein [Catonella morbi ATCC 51271]